MFKGIIDSRFNFDLCRDLSKLVALGDKGKMLLTLSKDRYSAYLMGVRKTLIYTAGCIQRGAVRFWPGPA